MPPCVIMDAATLDTYVDKYQETLGQTKLREKESKTNLIQRHLTLVTYGLGFVDDMKIQVMQQSLPNSKLRSTIWVQSKSRLGVGDLGVNPKRIEGMMNFMEKNIPSGFRTTNCSQMPVPEGAWLIMPPKE